MCKPQSVDDSEQEYEAINEYDEPQSVDGPEDEYVEPQSVDDPEDEYQEIVEATVNKTSCA